MPVTSLATLARSFRFEPVPGHEPEPVGRLTIRADNGIRREDDGNADDDRDQHGGRSPACEPEQASYDNGYYSKRAEQRR